MVRLIADCHDQVQVDLGSESSSIWPVAYVQASGLPRSPADEATARLAHVVDLQTLDEDRLGEQLSVV